MYSTPNIVWLIKTRRMRWAGHVARKGDRRVAYRVWWGDPRERDHLKNVGLNGRTILKWIFKK